MKASLQLKASQHLAMTPQLQQSIRLLQLSSVELQQEVAQALAENPMLEREEGEENEEGSESGGVASTAPETSTLEGGPSGEPDRQGEFDASPGATHDTTLGVTNGDEITDTATALAADHRIDIDDGPYDDGGGPGGSSGHDEDFEHEQADTAGITLREHLLVQAGLQRISWRELALLRILIEALDERGYLSSPLSEVLTTLPDEETVTLDELDVALTRLQEFDPPGVGARSLEECLLLQLRDLHDAAAPLARRLVAEYLPLLAQRDFTQLRRKTGANDDALRDAHHLIRSLNPHPGDAFLDDASPYIIPDVLVRRISPRADRASSAGTTDTRWQAVINPDALPRLKINRLYADLLRRSGDNGNKLTGQLQEARWLIKNIQQRFETIERVAQAIVNEQAEFFEKGELAMRPLVLREIADQLGLHESTISRVTSQKFMATPRGVLEFKYFFGSYVGTDDGGAASATAIKARIRQLVAGENPKKPLSDQQICDEFASGGIVVARRTIAKYREAMGIPTASLRKTL